MQRAGRVALVAAATAFAVLLAWQAFTLPGAVPGHVGATGEVSWWGTRTQHLVLGAVMLVGILLAFLLPVALVDTLPRSMLNLPHKEYWTRPENWPTARHMLAQDLGWLGAATLLCIGFVWWYIGAIATGTEGPAWVTRIVVGAYLVGVIAYAIWMNVGPRWRPPTT